MRRPAVLHEDGRAYSLEEILTMGGAKRRKGANRRLGTASRTRQAARRPHRERVFVLRGRKGVQRS